MARARPRPDEGRREWLSELYRAHARVLESYCRRFLNNAEDAADASHEVFLRALSSLDAPARSQQARSWLITVAQNYCLDLVRRRRRLQLALTTLGADSSNQAESEAEVINRQLLQTVLLQLGERERQALWQSAVERRTLTEIAGYLGLSYMAAAQLVHRARKHASVVAAKLAAILGLASANTLRRKSPVLTLAQSLAVVAVMPLVVVAIATPSSTAQAEHGARTDTQRAVAPSAAQRAVVAVNGVDLVPDNQSGAATRAHPVGRLVVGPLRSTLGPTLAAVEQAIQQLTGLSVPSSPVKISLPTPPPIPLLSPLPTPDLPKPPGTVST